ncbi:hypothetical protein M0R04_13555 [Candidatus Dojkabacteria bacterium]|jgi:hypothetical protein|nr:hypothetical protein [Candidatus Dojkabacteria bacterium]
MATQDGSVDISAFANPGLSWDNSSDAKKIAAAAAASTGNPYYYGGNVAQPQYTVGGVPTSGENWQPIGSGGNIDVNALLNQLTSPAVSVPKLDYTPPSSAELQGKWKEFLERAAKDPDIVNYYQKLLDQAAGDTRLAIDFLDRDYKMGVRHTSDNLSETLKQLGLISEQEQETLAGNLNKRNIAVTDMGGGKTAYAAGGQPARELGWLNEGQKLRKEAEQRSAGQKIEGMGLGREKGVTSANQQLQQFGTQTAYNKGQDIQSRASNYMGLYNQGQQSDLLSAQIKQQNQIDNPGQSNTRTHINPKSGVWDDNYYATGNTG